MSGIEAAGTFSFGGRTVNRNFADLPIVPEAD